VQSKIANGATPKEIEEFKKTSSSADRKTVMRKELQGLLAAGRKITAYGWFNIATTYAGLGDYDKPLRGSTN